MIGRGGDQSEEEEMNRKKSGIFDQAKLRLFVNDNSDVGSVERRPEDSSREDKNQRTPVGPLLGNWQDPIDEEGEEEAESNKMNPLERFKLKQVPKTGASRTSKIKFNFSLWEKNDGFASKRAVKRIFLNKSSFQSPIGTTSTKQFGNTTVDTSNPGTNEKPKMTSDLKQTSLMTEMSCSEGSIFLIRSRN